MNQIQLTENIYYVGVNDRHTNMFENHMELPNGVSYNSYLIVDDKVALIDPVEANFLEEYLFKVKSVAEIADQLHKGATFTRGILSPTISFVRCANTAWRISKRFFR